MRKETFLPLLAFLLVLEITLAQKAPDQMPNEPQAEGKPDQESQETKGTEESEETTKESGLFLSMLPVMLARSKSEDMATFEINSRSTEYFYHYIPEEILPSEISLAYFVSSSSKENISVKVFSPSEKEIFSRESRGEGSKHISVNEAGYYRIEFTNKSVIIFAPSVVHKRA